MKKRSIFNSKFFYRLTALIFALLLFVYVNSGHLSSTRNSSNSGTGTNGMLMSNKTVTLTANLKVNIDSDKYFVSGYPDKVKVKVSGPSAMVKTIQNTRNFDVYADLNGLGVGTHRVKLKTSGINRELTARVIPSKISVKISQRETATLPIQVRFDSSRIAEGYAAGKATSSYQVAQISGSADDISKIDSVVADISLPRDTRESYSRNVILRAIDSNGRTLGVNISPETVRVNVQVYRASASKKVSLNLVKRGQGVSGKSYELSTDTSRVTIRGTKEALDNMSSLTVPVSVAGINHSTTKSIQINPNKDGITSVEPESISVRIRVGDSGDFADQEDSMDSSKSSSASAKSKNDSSSETSYSASSSSSSSSSAAESSSSKQSQKTSNK